jgi:hypothetical protein
MNRDILFIENVKKKAIALAPSLRDKFDFSDDKQFTDWAKLAFKAANAFAEEEVRQEWASCKPSEDNK